MKLTSPISLVEIQKIVPVEIIGDANFMLTGINEIHKVVSGDLTFVDHPKYYKKALNSAASVVIINDKTVDNPQQKILLFSEDPFTHYNQLTRHFSPFRFAEKNLGENSIIHSSAKVFPNVFIGQNVQIGANSIVYPNTVIYDNTVVGDRVIIHSNTTVGADAFYFQKRENGYNKMHSCGRVVIEDDVEIGSNCTIDKGVSGDTIVGRGSKLDNQVHLGHGVVLGAECLLAAQVGIAGKTILGNGVILWGQVGVSKDLHIGDQAVVLAQSGVSKSLKGGKVYFGSPAREAKTVMKEMAIVRQLPKWWKTLNPFNSNPTKSNPTSTEDD